MAGVVLFAHTVTPCEVRIASDADHSRLWHSCSVSVLIWRRLSVVRQRVAATGAGEPAPAHPSAVGLSI
eukprot:scaffold16142_cov101-Isochrysis_galbana.AAC.1